MAGIKVDISANTTKLNNGLKRSKNALAAWAKSVVKKMAHAGANAAKAFARGLIRNIRRVGMVAGGLLVAGIGKSISVSAEFEKAEVQFEALMGSAEGARDRMKMLEDFALDVTFDLSSLIKANRHLQVFSDGAMAGRDAMKLIADAASVTPNEIEDVAFWFGRAYAMIDSGRPMGEAVMRLTEMGLMSREAAVQLGRLEKSYNPRAQARKLEILTRSFARFEGANDKLINTLSGQFSLFRDASTLAFKEVGDAIAPLTKKWLMELIAKVREFRADGTFQRWGENVAAAAMRVRTAIEGAVPAFKRFLDGAKKYLGEYKSFLDDGDFAGALRKSVSDGLAAAINAIQEHMPTMFAIGKELGGAIASGISEAVGNSMSGSWMGRRFVDAVHLLTGESSREMDRELDALAEEIFQELAEQRRGRAGYKPRFAEGVRLGGRSVQQAADQLTASRSTPGRALGANGEPIPVMIMNKPGGQ